MEKGGKEGRGLEQSESIQRNEKRLKQGDRDKVSVPPTSEERPVFNAPECGARLFVDLFLFCFFCC